MGIMTPQQERMVEALSTLIVQNYSQTEAIAKLKREGKWEWEETSPHPTSGQARKGEDNGY